MIDASADDGEVEVAGAQVVDDADHRRDERRTGEQPEPEPCEDHLAPRDGLLEPRHRRVQTAGAPEQVGPDPAGVEPELMVVEAVQRQQPVREIGHEQQADAGGEQVERGLAPAGVERQTKGRADQDHVAERVGDRDELGR